MIYLLIALQLADIATTHYALRFKIGTEANPFMRRLFDKFGHERVLLVSKTLFVVLLLVAQDYIMIEALYALVALYVYVVINNVKVIWKARNKNAG